MKTILTIELVPKTSWFTNLRSILSKENWDKLRKETYQKANYRCGICKGKGNKWPVECHEIWDYDDKNKIQKLKGLIALCPNCHMVKHMGFSLIKNKFKQACTHLMHVNKINQIQAEDIINNAFEIWKERSKYEWKLDLSYLETKGINYMT